MKKFFKKLPVLITFAVLTALFLALTIGLSVRPVSQGMTYSGTQTTVAGTLNITYKFKTKNEVAVKIGDSSETTCWYFCKGNKVLITAKAEDLYNYDEVAKSYMANSAIWESNSAFTINAFSMNRNAGAISASTTAGGAIAVTVIFSVLSAVCIAGTVLSAVFYSKNKKSTKTSK